MTIFLFPIRCGKRVCYTRRKRLFNRLYCYYQLRCNSPIGGSGFWIPL